MNLTKAKHPQCLGMTFMPGDLEPWTVPDERVVCLFHNWVNSYNYIGEADWDRRRLTFARPAGAFFLGPKVRYYLENAFEYLDAPGDGFLDRESGKLFNYPVEGEDMTQAEGIAPLPRATSDVSNFAATMARITKRTATRTARMWMAASTPFVQGPRSALA